MKKRIMSMMMVAALTASLFAGCGGGAKTDAPAADSTSKSESSTTEAPADEEGATLDMNLSSPVGPTHPAIIALTEWADVVKTESGGNLTINVFDSGSLGDQPDGLAGLKQGTLSMQHCNSGPSAQLIPELDVFNLPYMFNSGDHLTKAMEGEIGQWVSDKWEEAGYHYLGWIYGGSRSVITDVGAIEKPADLNGLKIRVQSSDTMVAMMNAMGGIGTAMAQSEVYSALQQGVIDGWENSVITLQSLSLYEVSQYFSRTEHLINPDFLIMAQSDWDALSASQQEMITTTVKAALDHERELWLETESDTEAQLVEEGVTFNDVDKDAFKEACTSLWDDYKGKFGEDLINKIQAIN